MNEPDCEMVYQTGEFGLSHIYVKGGLGDLISSLWKHCLMSGARFKNDD